MHKVLKSWVDHLTSIQNLDMQSLGWNSLPLAEPQPGLGIDLIANAPTSPFQDFWTKYFIDKKNDN